MAGNMNHDCLDAIWSIVKFHAYMESVLIQEGREQDAAKPKNWMLYPLALPQDVVGKATFNVYSEQLPTLLKDIAQECQSIYPESPPAQQLTAFGAAEDFKSPFARDSEPDPYELWNQLQEMEDAIMGWIDSIFLEPSRHAMSR